MRQTSPKLEIDASFSAGDIQGVVALVTYICGEATARKLVREAGGGRIFVPLSPAPHHRICQIIGFENTVELARECGGVTFDVAVGREFRGADRLAAVERLTRKGKTVSQITKALNCSRRSVFKDRAKLRALSLSHSSKVSK